MVNLITTTDLSFEDAKNYGIGSINLVKEFLKNLNEKNSTSDLDVAIGELDEIISRIEGNSNPLRNNADVDAHFTRAIGEIIHCRSAIITQLNNFWDAHLKIAEKAVEQGRSYAIMQMADENREKILDIDNRYSSLTSVIGSNNSDDISDIFAMFYIHNLKTEVIEHSFVLQLNELLQEFELNEEFSAEDIFSSTTKVQKGNVWKTDARAIRDALGHNKYDLEITDDSWIVKFCNHEKGYTFSKSFTGIEFRTFLTDTDYLYRCSMMILFAFSGMTVIKQHCLQHSIL